MNIAIIPARGGSKRIPRKNIRHFAGKPMIAYAIRTVVDSGLFERVVVSTDDAEVASIADAWGAEVPFLRPTDLADDHTPTVPVVADAINRCEALGWRGEYICCVYPCAPFISADDLHGALAALRSSDLDYCFAVAEYPSAVQRALRRAPDGTISPMYPEHELTRTQDLDKAYRDAGQFYWGSRTAWLTNPRLHSSSKGFVIPGWRAIDIDTEDDWRRAELQHQLVSPPRGAADREGGSNALS